MLISTLMHSITLGNYYPDERFIRIHLLKSAMPPPTGYEEAIQQVTPNPNPNQNPNPTPRRTLPITLTLS